MKKTLIIMMILFFSSCSDPSRCDLSGCDNRKSGYYLMKDFPQMGGAHSSRQTGWKRSKHAYRGKEFCSIGHANSWYEKL